MIRPLVPSLVTQPCFLFLNPYTGHIKVIKSSSKHRPAQRTVRMRLPSHLKQKFYLFMLERWKWAHSSLLDIGAHGRIPLQVHKDGENCLCGHTLSGLLENSFLASPLWVVPREGAAQCNHLQSRDGPLSGSKWAKRRRQNGTVTFPLLFHVRRIVVIPVTHI